MSVLSHSSKKCDCQRQHVAALFTETDYRNSTLLPPSQCNMYFKEIQAALQNRYKQIQYLHDVVESSLPAGALQ